MRPCCVLPALRQVVQTLPDRVVEQCRACGSRHIAFAVDPVVTGIILPGASQ